MLTDICVYTIKHSDDLRASQNKGGADTYTEKKRWVRVQRMLDSARDARVPIVFAPAEGTAYLFAWALLDKVVVGEETTEFTFSDLRLIKSRKPKSLLVKDSEGEPLDSQFIRPYAICRTPADLANWKAE
jgi:hypothetical protein